MGQEINVRASIRSQLEKRGTIENPAMPLVAPAILTASGYNINTPFGIITPSVALSASTVYACLKVIAETIASLDGALYEITTEGRRKATEHPAHQLVWNRPNPFMSSYVWRERMIYSRYLYGNSYDGIIRNGAGRPIELRPVRADAVNVGILNDKKVLKYNGEYFPDTDFLHVPNTTLDGITGVSTITFARTSISLSLAAEQHGARLFSQGTSGTMWIESEKPLPQDQLERLRESWAGNYSGITNAHKVPIMQNGMKLHSIEMSNEDAQFLQTRQFSVADIARWFRVPPHKIGDLSKATNNNIEHQGLEFIVDCIRPIAVVIEQEWNNKLLLPSEQGRYYFQFNLDSLARGDLKTRYDSYAVGRQWGWLCADDICAAENMNNLPGGQGRVYLDPLNMVPATAFVKPQQQAAPVGQQPTKEPSDDDDDALGGFDDERASKAAVAAAAVVLVDAIGRMDRKAAEATKRAASKPGSYGETVGDFYRKHADTLEQAITPAFVALAAQLATIRNTDTTAATETARAFAATAARKLADQQAADVANVDAIEQATGTWLSALHNRAQLEADALARLVR